MSDWLFTLRDRFGPSVATGWNDYVHFSGFSHVTELVSMDSVLCHDAIEELTDEDWDHNVHEDFRISFFRDLEYLLTRQPLDGKRHQILAVLENPARPELLPPNFAFCGFDIVDAYCGNSTLTNCGPMPDIFRPSDVNNFGLIHDLGTADTICARMRAARPDDPHLGNCSVWQVGRLLPSG